MRSLQLPARCQPLSSSTEPQALGDFSRSSVSSVSQPQPASIRGSWQFSLNQAAWATGGSSSLPAAPSPPAYVLHQEPTLHSVYCAGDHPCDQPIQLGCRPSPHSLAPRYPSHSVTIESAILRRGRSLLAAMTSRSSEQNHQQQPTIVTSRATESLSFRTRALQSASAQDASLAELTGSSLADTDKGGADFAADFSATVSCLDATAPARPFSPHSASSIALDGGSSSSSNCRHFDSAASIWTAPLVRSVALHGAAYTPLSNYMLDPLPKLPSAVTATNPLGLISVDCGGRRRNSRTARDAPGSQCRRWCPTFVVQQAHNCQEFYNHPETHIDALEIEIISASTSSHSSSSDIDDAADDRFLDSSILSAGEDGQFASKRSPPDLPADLEDIFGSDLNVYASFTTAPVIAMPTAELGCVSRRSPSGEGGKKDQPISTSRGPKFVQEGSVLPLPPLPVVPPTQQHIQKCPQEKRRRDFFIESTPIDSGIVARCPSSQATSGGRRTLGRSDTHPLPSVEADLTDSPRSNRGHSCNAAAGCDHRSSQLHQNAAYMSSIYTPGFNFDTGDATTNPGTRTRSQESSGGRNGGHATRAFRSPQIGSGVPGRKPSGRVWSDGLPAHRDIRYSQGPRAAGEKQPCRGRQILPRRSAADPRARTVSVRRLRDVSIGRSVSPPPQPPDQNSQTSGSDQPSRHKGQEKLLSLASTPAETVEPGLRTRCRRKLSTDLQPGVGEFESSHWAHTSAATSFRAYGDRRRLPTHYPVGQGTPAAAKAGKLRQDTDDHLRRNAALSIIFAGRPPPPGKDWGV